MKVAAVIGRGHSGTRAVVRALASAGFVLPRLNASEDYPSPAGYRAARIAGSKIKPGGPHGWDLDPLLHGPIDPAWRESIEEYLHRVYTAGPLTGWKLPEMTFCYPWLVRAYPEIRFSEIHRDPRDTILKPHGTDNIEVWCRQIPTVPGLMAARGQSWALQTDILLRTAAELEPAFWARLRLRDFVDAPNTVQGELSRALGEPMPRIVGNPNAIDRHKREQHNLSGAMPFIGRHLAAFSPRRAGAGPAV